jgi:hypothetical protein
MFHKLLVRLYLSLLFSSNLATSYCLDHRPRIIGNEKVVQSQFHADSSGMWAFAPSESAIKYVLLPLGPHNATGPPTALTEIAKSNPGNVHLQTNILSPPQSSPQPISPSHISADYHDNHHNIKYLEQLLDSSIATVAVIQFSGNTLADVLTPRAYNTFKALYALADLDAAAAASSPVIPGQPNPFSDRDIDNDCPFSNNHSPPSPNSSLAVPRNGRIYISIPVDYVMLFSWVGLAALSFLVFFSLSRLCERD